MVLRACSPLSRRAAGGWCVGREDLQVKLLVKPGKLAFGGHGQQLGGHGGEDALVAGGVIA